MEKPVINVSVPFDELVDRAEEVLAAEPSVFQRNGELVSVDIDEDGKMGLRPLRSSIVRYMLSRVATWIKTVGSPDNEYDKIVHPPSNVGKCLIDKSHWNHILHLRATTPFPPISSDGKIRTTKGYDPGTLVFFSGGVDCNVQQAPTKQDAIAGAKKLLNLVCDFPFASDAHRSAWIAGLLSPLARFLHDGNAPLTVVQANSPRVGKTTLVKLISHIITGDDCPVITHTSNEDEGRKRILSYLRMSRAMVLVDNVVGQYGGPGINALITSRIFEDRILGHSKVIQTVNDTTWYITGNNVTLAPDTAERCLHIRLHSDEEKPHLRTSFKHDVFAVVKERRSELLSAALTILKAYIVAGMPDQNIPPWGSFESWSRIVRGAIVWTGLEDPGATREELEVESDVNRHVALDIIEGWSEFLRIVRSEDGITIREALQALNAGTDAPRLRAALEDMSGSSRLPSTHKISRYFREIKDRNFAGKMLRNNPDPQNSHRWFVEQVESK